MDFKKWIAGALSLVTGSIAAFWLGLYPLMQLLLVLIVLDILSGLIGAFMRKEVSSTVSWAGIGKKALILIIVAGAEYAGNLADLQISETLTLGAMVAGFYAVNEFISILENAAAAGIPIPKFLRDVLQKLNSEKFEPTDPTAASYPETRAQG